MHLFSTKANWTQIKSQTIRSFLNLPCIVCICHLQCQTPERPQVYHKSPIPSFLLPSWGHWKVRPNVFPGLWARIVRPKKLPSSSSLFPPHAGEYDGRRRRPQVVSWSAFKGQMWLLFSPAHLESPFAGWMEVRSYLVETKPSALSEEGEKDIIVGLISVQVIPWRTKRATRLNYILPRAVILTPDKFGEIGPFGLTMKDKYSIAWKLHSQV